MQNMYIIISTHTEPEKYNPLVKETPDERNNGQQLSRLY